KSVVNGVDQGVKRSLNELWATRPRFDVINRNALEHITGRNYRIEFRVDRNIIDWKSNTSSRERGRRHRGIVRF
ncbi:MAG: hypothetical protein J0M07_23945, partial [Anaerolineae bacterium]|nr:hypothetical protein [Anaerolineae bacterium]